MDSGLLWWDGDPKRPLEDKIEHAAERYSRKYGRWPNTCYVHPQAVDGQNGDEARLTCQPRNSTASICVLTAPNILRHHLWLGERKQKPAAEGGVPGS